ncbi:cysteine dioxygenase family protein [Saccharomonospora sp. NPDC046836]|uniref:cysteine dioxygenase n=1 Tax=Saccharomonospora sp. NPDC046836 TaxID=3156921 RepID=UPI0033FE4FA2
MDVDVHPGLASSPLATMVQPDRPLWTPRELRTLTSATVRQQHGELLDLVRYEPRQRWWVRLALTRGVELWLLSWLPGQGTQPHDHGGAAGSFAVLAGSLEESYRYPGGPLRTARHAAGAAIGFGAGHAHQVRNTGNSPAASVHAYSPPLVPTREYPGLHAIPAEIPPLPALHLPFAELRARADLEGP